MAVVHTLAVDFICTGTHVFRASPPLAQPVVCHSYVVSVCVPPFTLLSWLLSVCVPFHLIMVTFCLCVQSERHLPIQRG